MGVPPLVSEKLVRLVFLPAWFWGQAVVAAKP